MTKLAVAVGFLALNFYTYHFLAEAAVIPRRTEFSEFPMELGDWTCTQSEKMTREVERNLGVTDYLICQYERPHPPAAIGMYVGYHENQVREEGGGSKENAIHPPAHCLPGSGWDIIASEKVDLDIPGLPQSPASVNRLTIAKGNLRHLVYYWYQSRGRVIADDWKKILYVGFDHATKRRTDGSLVRFTVPLIPGGAPHAEAAFRDFAPRVIAHLADYVPE